MNKRKLYGLFVLILATLACRPVLTISWNELFIVGVVFTVLLGPPVYRLIGRVGEFLKHEKDKK